MSPRSSPWRICLVISHPNIPRLSAEIETLQGISSQNLGSDQTAQIQETLSAHENELATYDALLAKLNATKDGPAASSSRISQLQRRIAANRHGLVVNENVKTAVNVVTGLFGRHVDVETNEDRQEAIDRDQAEIARLQADQAGIEFRQQHGPARF